MLRGSFHPHRTASAGRLRSGRRRPSEIAGASRPRVRPRPFFSATYEVLVDPAVGVVAEFEGVLVAVEVEPDVHASHPDDSREDTRSGAPGRSDHIRSARTGALGEDRRGRRLLGGLPDGSRIGRCGVSRIRSLRFPAGLGGIGPAVQPMAIRRERSRASASSRASGLRLSRTRIAAAIASEPAMSRAGSGETLSSKPVALMSAITAIAPVPEISGTGTQDAISRTRSPVRRVTIATLRERTRAGRGARGHLPGP